MIDIATGKSDVSDHALRRMKKECVVELFRKTEEKLHGATAGHNMFVNSADAEILDLNNQIDDFLIQEDMNKKTVNELNESNKKLMEKIKFYQDQKENNKNKENKVADYVNNGLIEKIESLEVINKNLEKEKQELIEECKGKNEWNEELQEEVQKWKEQVEENYKHHYDQLEPVLLENEKLREDDKRIRCKNRDLQLLLQNTSNEFKSILRKYPNPNVMLPIVQDWITDFCEECENDTSGESSIAPTELDNLYCDFKCWSQEQDHDSPTRNVFKENLKIWQANSRFGLDIGEKKSDSGVNGYEAKPRFNLKVI